MRLLRLTPLISLVLCATAQAQTSVTATFTSSNPTDPSLVACHMTLAGLTVLGIAFSLGRSPLSLVWTRRRA